MRVLDPVGWLGQLSFAARRLRRAPIFAIAATALLGAGMAIAAATLSLLNVALYKDAARDMGLVHIGIHPWVSNLPDEVVRGVVANPPASFEALAGFGLTQGAVVADGVSHRAAIESVTGPYFPLVDAVPTAGRLIDTNEASEDARVAVISRQFWRAAFEERPDVVGEAIVVGGKHLVIVGVLERAPRPGARGADVWVPSHVLPVNTLFGRLQPGTTIEQATAEVAGRYGLFEVPGGQRATLVRAGLSAPVPPRDYLIIASMVGLALAVSLVASVSFGLLLFARMAATQSELAIRIALGATTRDLTRLLAFEVILLALVGTFVAVISGVLLARFVAVQMIEASGWQAVIDTSADWRVFLAVSGLTMAVALAVVARLGWRATEVEALGSMVATGGMGGATLRTAGTSTRLVIAQSAATAALLLCAALIMRSALGEISADGAIDVRGAAIAWIDPAGAATPGAGTMRARRVLDAATDLPGVRSAAIISNLPGSPSSNSGVLINSTQRRHPDVHYVSTGAFDAFALSVVRGRTFTAQEDERGEAVSIVSDTAARTFWPGLEPIGRRLSIFDGPSVSLDTVVIGVASDVDRWQARREGPPAAVYLPAAHRPASARLAVVARGDEAAGGLADQFRTSLQRGVPDVGFLAVRTLEEEIHERLAAPPAIPRVLGLLGLIVFLVAMGGLYGLMSYLAAMRRREMAIRKALGATRLALCRMLARESNRMLAIGIMLGITAGLLIGNLMRSSSNFRLLDPVAILGVAGFMYAAGLVGAIAPFLRTINATTERLRD